MHRSCASQLVSVSLIWHSDKLKTCWIRFKDSALLGEYWKYFQSGQRGIDMLNFSCVIDHFKLVAGGDSDSGQILHVEHVSLVLLEHQSLYQKRRQHHQNPFLQYCQPEDFCPWYSWQVLNICSQHLLSLESQCPKSTTGVPSSSNDRKQTIPPLPWHKCT